MENKELNCKLEAVKRVYEGKDGEKHETTDYRLYDKNGYYVLIKPAFPERSTYMQLSYMAEKIEK